MEKIYLSARGGVPIDQYGFKHPMYKGANEILDIIMIAIYEVMGKSMDIVRTIESGIVEEYVVVEKHCNYNRLLFRMWPVFYSHDKRVEYKIYNKNSDIQELVSYYLSIFAEANAARLVVKT